MALLPRPSADETLLELLVRALPPLRAGLNTASARVTAELLRRSLGLDAAAVVLTDRILAFSGAGSDHHREGMPYITRFTQDALSTGRIATTRHRTDIGCPVPDCPLSSAIIAPLVAGSSIVGALKLYHAWGTPFDERDERIAAGLARVFGVYLEIAELDARAQLVHEAELGALRAQISPHFLFNTLTTIAALTRIDALRAHDLLVDFADFFRHTLANHGELVTLREELEQTDRYTRFELARFGEHLRIVHDIDSDMLDVRVPVLCVQPLVENAIGHGLAPRGGDGTVRIRAHRAEDGAMIAVADDGIGMSAERRARALEVGIGDGLGIGLSNVDRRLRLLFGSRSGLSIVSEPERGTVASFWIPA
ncbi:MAG: histidine kinase [Vulcanimicrobiaceae bacterium]